MKLFLVDEQIRKVGQYSMMQAKMRVQSMGTIVLFF